MNKLLFTSALFFIFSFAQLKQGNFLAGGSITFNTGKEKTTYSVINNVTTVVENKFTDLNLSPKFGFFVANNLAIGIQANLIRNSVDGHNDHTILGVGLFMRYYFPVKIFGEGYLGYASQNYVDSSTKYNGLDYSIGFGYALFVSKKVAIEPIIKYVGYSTKNSNDNRYKNSNGALQIGLGFQIYF